MRSALLLLVLLAFGSAALAQFEIRPFAGANFSDIQDTPDGTSTQAKIGAQFGASVLIGNKFHIMPGIGMFFRSTEYSSPGNVDDFDQTTNGVMIPILVGYRFVDPTAEPFLNVRVFAGPSLMFLTKTELSRSGVNDEINWKDSQWGAQVGLGFDVSIFFIDAGYEWGLSNTGSVSDNVPAWDELKSNTFFVNVGARLQFAR